MNGREHSALYDLMIRWRAAADELAFEGEEYDNHEEETSDEMSKVYAEAADALDEIIGYRRKPRRVAVVVFCEAYGVDDLDAAMGAQYAIHKRLAGDGKRTTPIEIPTGVERLPEPTIVHGLMEAGMAAGNGHLWTYPTSKSFPRQETSDGE